MNSIEAYKILAKKFPNGFTFSEAKKTLNCSSSGVVGSNLKILIKHGFIKQSKQRGQPSKYFPLYFHCEKYCRVRTAIIETLEKLTNDWRARGERRVGPR